MRGFKDDFYAWKDSLSKDEQALILKQAQNEFDKKFRKSDTFSQDLPEEKIQSFAKVLKKFFDNDARLKGVADRMLCEAACAGAHENHVACLLPQHFTHGQGESTLAGGLTFLMQHVLRKRMTTRRLGHI